jgi:hypothetical protein
MEDVLDIYELPYDESRLVVCMDEKPYQLLGEERYPVPVRPCSDEKADSECVRNSARGVFVFTQPSGETRHASVRERPTAVDWAHEIKYLSDEMYPDAQKIILVMDNLNTHKPALLYKVFLPDDARRILKRLEIHYTPKHGSRIDTAEVESNIMTRQYLSRRTDPLLPSPSGQDTRTPVSPPSGCRLPSAASAPAAKAGPESLPAPVPSPPRTR